MLSITEPVNDPLCTLIEPDTLNEPVICASPMNGNPAPLPPNEDVAARVVILPGPPTQTYPSCKCAWN